MTSYSLLKRSILLFLVVPFFIPSVFAKVKEDEVLVELPVIDASLGGDMQTMSLGGSGDPNALLYFNTLTRTSDVRADAQDTGAFTYTIPLTMPAGRAGMQPDLTLSYNSHAHAQEGNIYGAGWSVSIPTIERLNKTGIQNIFTETSFSSSLDGELKPVSLSDGMHGTYGAEIEGGSFDLYTFNIDGSWTVEDKSGIVYTFGKTAASRQDKPGDATKIYTWMLSEVRDANDNYMSYSYYKDAGQIYPSAIVYTGHGTTDGIYSVEFIRGSRSDVVKQYTTGFAVTTSYRISDIYAKVNGIWTHRYALAYATGDNTVRSLLSSVTESHRDESGGNAVTFDPYVFTYSQSGSKMWSEETAWTVPGSFADFAGPATVDSGGRLVDVNGDGLVDFFAFGYSLDGVWISPKVYINNGSDLVLDASWTFPEDQYQYESAGDLRLDKTATRFADVNGDGYIDIIKNIQWSTNFGEYPILRKIYINNGNGWDHDASWTFPIDPVTGTTLLFRDMNYDDKGVRVEDANGDGLPDLLRKDWNANEVFFDNGESGWEYASGITMPSSSSLQFVDVNGDTLTDILYYYNDTGSVYIHTGSGWALDVSWVIPRDDASQDGIASNYADINGDGLVDIVRAYERYQNTPIQKAYLNTGSGWVYDPSWVIPVNFRFYYWYEGSSTWTLRDNGVRIGDVNGDGVADLVQGVNDLRMGESAYYDEHHVFINSSDVVDLLTGIETPQGGATSAAYQTTPMYEDGSGGNANPDLPFILNTVSSVTVNDGLGNETTTTYTYEGGDYYYNTADDRKFAGFHKVTTVKNGTVRTVEYFHQGNGNDGASYEANDTYAKIGRSYRKEVYDAYSQLFDLATTSWEGTSLGNDRYFVRPSQVINYSYDGDGIHKDTAETYTYSTSSGNFIEKKEYGEVMANPATGTFTDVGTDKTKTTYVYAIRNSKETALPSVVHVYGNDEVTDLAITGYYYDNLPLYQTSNGNRTKTDEWINIYGIYYPTTYTYNSYGLVTSETNPRNYTTNYSYDGYNLYPATVTNALSQITTYTYDYNAGKEKRVTDPNGFVTETTYDGFGRPLLKKITGQDGVTLVTKEEYTYNDTAFPSSAFKREYLSTDAAARETYSYYDGLERLIQSRATSDTANQWDVTTVKYDTLGRVWKEYIPFTNGSSAYAATTQADAQATVYNYDTLDRLTQTITSVGTTNYTHNDWTKLITDANNHQKKEYYDARGALVRVDEYGNTGTYTTTYLYDARGNLTRITDAEGNIRNFTYDSLKRQLTNELAHAPASPASTYSYTYDANGNKTQETYPDGHSVSWTYDALDRVLTESSGGETKVTYAYDTALNGIGKLASVTTAASTKTYTYDEQGNVASDIETIQEAIQTGGGATQTDLVAHYTFNEGTGTVANDSAGMNNGTLINMEVGDWVTGVSGYALNFGGTDELVTLSNPASLQLNGNFSISFWFNSPNIALDQRDLIDKGFDKFITLGILNSRLYFGYPGALNVLAGDTILSSNTWYNYTVTWDGTTVRLYLNGALDKEQNITMPTDQTANWLIAGNSYGGFWTGKMDDLRIYNTALSAADIQELYLETGMAAYWPMNEGAGTTAADESGNGHPGTLINGPVWTTGKTGNALQFDGVNDYIHADASLAAETGSISSSAWIYVDALPTQKVSIVNAGGYYHHCWLDASGKIWYGAWTSQTNEEYLSTGAITVGQWNHIVVVNDFVGNTTKAYINGALAGTTALNGDALAVTYFDIGRHPGYDGNYLTGKIDDVRVYTTALSAADVLALYNDIGDGLIAHYTFEEGTGTDTYDEVNNKRAWFLNSPTWTTTGAQGRALSFDGEQADYLDSEFDLPNGGDLTQSVWVYYEPSDSIRAITGGAQFPSTFGTAYLGIGTGETQTFYSIFAETGQTEELPHVNIGNIANAWTHLVSTFDSETKTVKLYKNGQPVLTQTIQRGYNWDVGNTFRIGTSWGWNQWNGSLDDLRIYNKVLTDTDVQALYQETLPATYEPETFTTTYAHDNYGATQSITYPDSAVVAYTYNKLGAVQALSKNGATVVSSISYGPHGKRTAVSYANGVAETYTYNEGAQYRLMWKSVNQGGVWLQNINYAYDPVGNITYLKDHGTALPKEVWYTYDNLNRLTGTTGTITESYTYSPTGNILSKSDVGTYAYADGRHPYAATSAGANTYTYDLDGNLATSTEGGVSTYAYDHANRLSTITKNGQTTTYVYANTRDRIQKQGADGSHLTYIGTYAEMDGEGTYTDYFFVGDNRVATFEDGTLYYNIQDHLSSSALTLNTAGTVVQKIDYFPFGAERLNEKTGDFDTHFTFTDQEKDSESGLMYYGARYYNPILGRFTQVDPAAIQGTPGFYAVLPQNWNTYSYTANNPVVYVDPNGTSIQTGMQGLASSVTYAYHHPFKTAAVVGVGVVVAVISPVVALLAGTALGGYAVGAAGYNAYAAPTADVRDYYIGQGVGAGLLTGIGIKSAGSLGSANAIETSGIVANAQKGAAFETRTLNALQKQGDFVSQLTLKTNSGIKTRIDIVGRNQLGEVCLLECKSSAAASLTKNQKAAFPQIENSGATVVGKGKPGFPGGTAIPPTKVDIVRPSN